jgi:hypothetical protein
MNDDCNLLERVLLAIIQIIVDEARLIKSVRLMIQVSFICLTSKNQIFFLVSEPNNAFQNSHRCITVIISF